MYKISLVFWSMGELGIFLSRFTDLYYITWVGIQLGGVNICEKYFLRVFIFSKLRTSKNYHIATLYIIFYFKTHFLMAKAKKILDIIRSILSLSFRLQKLISPIHSKQYMYVIQTGKSLKPRFEGLSLGIK